MKLGLFNILIILLLQACSTGSHIAPVDVRKQPPSQRIQQHTVSQGETLYAIAWRYGLSVQTLARFNGLSSPYTIFPGQELSLWTMSKAAKSRAKAKPPKPSARVKTAAKASAPAAKTPRAKVKAPNQSKNKPRSKTKTQPSSRSESQTSKVANIFWRWPAKGRLLARFGGPNGLNKGVDIAGKLGEPVISAAAGRVVYAGNGLRGYGQLLIIKHSDQYLSAYAHNHKLRVQEGDTVKAGQRIADIGSSGANRVKLHFEIRKDGKSVDPLRYLPKR